MKIVLKFAKRIGLGLLAVLAAFCVTGLAMAAAGWGPPPRGVMVDVDGRLQRIVCEGEARPGVPTVVFEAGAYSGSADWGWLQPQAAKGGRTCSYDRAGMGWSQPAAGSRDPGQLARELHRLLEVTGEAGPYVLVGHSMAGLLTQSFITQYPDEVVGLVLIDAADPSAIDVPEARVWIKRFQDLASLMAGVAPTGLLRPFSLVMSNKIGLDGLALKEKKRMFGAASHLKASAAEINATLAMKPEDIAADPYLARMPVAALTAGPSNGGAWQKAQERAAGLSPSGSVEAVAQATHTSILGPVHGQRVLAAIDRVRTQAANRNAQP
jgi:pimeloyl-ACP methyl ester carboxylesterase